MTRRNQPPPPSERHPAILDVEDAIRKALPDLNRATSPEAAAPILTAIVQATAKVTQTPAIEARRTAERRLLGTLLMNPEHIPTATRDLAAEDFGEWEQREVWVALCNVAPLTADPAAAMPAALGTIVSKLTDDGLPATPDMVDRLVGDVRRHADTARVWAAAREAATFAASGNRDAALAALASIQARRPADLRIFSPADWPDDGGEVPALVQTIGREPRTVIPRGLPGILAGEGGAGKTRLAVQLAVSVAAGRPWLDCSTPAGGAPVLLVLAEEGEASLRRRVVRAREALALGEGTRADAVRAAVNANLRCLSLAGEDARVMAPGPGRGALAETGIGSRLRALAGEIRPALVVLDPLSMLAPDDAEKDAAAASAMVRWLRWISEDTGATVLLTHHVRKPDKGDVGALTQHAIRGSSGLTAAARWALGLWREVGGEGEDDDDRTRELLRLRVLKSNDFAPPRSMPLVWADGGVLRPATDPEVRERKPPKDNKPSTAAKRGAAPV